LGLYADKIMLEQKQEQQFIQAIDEVYFGRTPSINNLFNAYCDWREPLLTPLPKLWSNSFNNWYNKQHEYFEDMVCKQFGFNTFSYQVGSDNRTNSCTLSYGLLPFGASSKEIIIDKDGYKFKDNTKFNSVVIVYPALIFNPDFTHEEAFSIFLHEIGHNFQAAANNTIFCLAAATGLFRLMLYTIQYKSPIEAMYTLLLTSNISRGIINKIHNTMSRNSLCSNLLVCVNMMLYAIKHCIHVVKYWSNLFLIPINSIMSLLYALPSLLIEIITGIHSYNYYCERFADSFAASYGFGPAVASSQNKFANITTGDPTTDIVFNDIPVFSHVLKLAMLPTSILLTLIDVHPDSASRCASVIKDMKRDLDDPKLDPKLRKQLAKEVDEYELAMNQYFDEATKLKNPNIVGAFLQRYIYELGGGAKMKLSELPYMRIGGFGSQTNKNTNNIIINTKIK
jgi:hypothetical protein